MLGFVISILQLPKDQDKSAREEAAAQAVGCPVAPGGFLAVSVLYRAPPYFFLCRVSCCRKGQTSCAILSYISTRAFRVTLRRRAV